MLQTCAAAKNEKVLRRSALFVGPLNTIIGVFSCTFALTAKSMPQYANMSPKTYTVQMLVDMLPPWLLTLILGAFLAALLSSWAGFVMSSSTILVMNFIKEFFLPKMNEKQVTMWIRIMIVISVIIVISLSSAMPPVIMLFTWMFSFATPVFFLYISGLWWKRNQIVAILACVVPWILSSLWTFTPLAKLLGMENVAHIYLVLITSAIIIIVGNLITKGKVGYFRSEEYRSSEGYQEYLREQSHGEA